ncbi:rhamnan synthesis F family protein [Paraburkholderia acidisoli]|uniref:rhamnan synthesis F family protein n=1 Tax=Paraburkholderia acidisoli TaxID=2571748 RepID=UPI00131D5211|nr:rhamnan synthesis F family protein [Paraburkholderia acidisoli]
MQTLLVETARGGTQVVEQAGLARTLPLWYKAAQLLHSDTLTVIALRHPEDTLTSCWLRDALARPLALAVWLDALLSAELASRGRPRVWVRHHDLLADWQAPLRAIATRLDVPFPPIDEAKHAMAARVLLGARSRASDAFEPHGDDKLGELASRAWRAALALVRNPDDRAAQEALDAVRAELSQAVGSAVDTDADRRLESNLERISEALNERDSILRESSARYEAEHQRVEDVEREAHSLRDEVASRAKHVAQLEQHVGQLQGDLHRKQESLADVEREVARLRLENVAMSDDTRRANEALLKLRSDQASGEDARGRELSRALREASVQLADARAQVQLVYSSMSWRVSAPLRVIGRALPADLRSGLSRTARFGWRTLTPWRNAQRRILAQRSALDARAVETVAEPVKQESPNSAAINPPARVGAPKASPEQLRLAQVIRHSEYFDEARYDALSGASASGIEPALHYVLYGEAQGLAPSDRFDPGYYGDRYPDIVAWGGNRLGHYIERGRTEGRDGMSLTATIPMPVDNIDPARPTVAVVVHEASRTGAPILGWNIVRVLKQRFNVVAVVLRPGGALESSFAEVANVVVGSVAGEKKVDLFNAIDGFHFGARLAEVYGLRYVIANSVETRSLVPGLADRGVPTVALVHEFSGYTKPVGSLQALYEHAAEVVFPADIVRRSSEADYPILRLRHAHVLPQGPSEVPKAAVKKTKTASASKVVDVRARLRPPGAEEALLVVGMGFVDWRKGVDLFVGALTSLVGRYPRANVRFVWVGHGFKVSDALDIASYLAEQVERSGVGNRFAFVDAVENVEDIYEQADVLFLSSRLDPLPNVSIDAALRGIPVVCFADASGTAEILAASETTRSLVVPHLDAGAAADVIARLAEDRNQLQALGDAVQTLARERFDMERYVQSIDALGSGARSAMEQAEADVQTILESGAFDAPQFLGASASQVPLERAVRRYVAQAAKLDYAALPVSGAYTRRPAAGFNPYTYGRAGVAAGERERGEPFARWLRSGKPAGAWAHPVIRVDASAEDAKTKRPATALKVALHAHIFYTELVSELLDAVAANAQPCRLILTTDSLEKAAEINLLTERYGVPADVKVVANRGRDVGPFLKVLSEIGDQYDVIGHVHGKRSLTTENVASDFGERWRTFLWQHLIGDSAPMIDHVMHAFADDSRLGLVFPEDPHLIGWEENTEVAAELAAKMGWQSPLPATLDFPVGTMFWARPQALRDLLALGLSDEDYPEEPVPTDGTILHAIERLIPCAVVHAGYGIATTYLPEFTR